MPPGLPDPGLRGVPARVLDLVRALRRAGVPVAVSDSLDALRAAAEIDLLAREQLREALAATMTTSAGQRVVFDPLFDLWFPRTTDEAPDGAGAAPGDAEGGGTGEPPAPRDVRDFLADLVAALLHADDAALRRLAREAVAGYGRAQGADGRTAYYAYRVYREFNLGGVLARALGEAGFDARDDLEARLQRDELEARLRRFREAIEAELRRRTAELRGPEEVARRTVRPPLEDVDLFTVTAAEHERMRAAVRPLARKLATRLAVRRKRARDGRLDVRRTLRHTLSTGGVPIDPVFRSKRVHRPELVLLCDVSGSVASFARFTLMLCHALQGQFARVRSFAFVDTVDEVTDLFEDGDFGGAMRRLSTDADVVWLDGHSDYGHALEVFATRYRAAVTPRSTVLVLGDARSNYRAANAWALQDVAERAKRTYWLNPEPRAHWDTGDSIASVYARACDEMAECRTLRQLTRFIEAIA